MSYDDGKMPIALVLQVALGLACLYVAWCILRHCCCLPTQAALLEQDFLGNFADGLERQNLDDPNAVRWACPICAFENQLRTMHCVLCDATKDTVPTAALSLRQQSAMRRKQWARTLSPAGVLQWSSSESMHGQYVITYDALAATVAWTPLASLSPDVAPAFGETLALWQWRHLLALQDASFTTKVAALCTVLSHTSRPATKLNVYRDLAFESIDMLLQIPHASLCSTTSITMLGESGVDAGGLQREWYSLVLAAILAPSRGLFCINHKDDGAYMIDPTTSLDAANLSAFRAVGRLLARALLEGQVLPQPLCVPLLKALVGAPLSVADIAFLDPVTASSLHYVATASSVDDLCLDFTVSTGTDKDLVALVQNGHDMPVTLANRSAYVDCMVQYLLFDRIAQPLASLLRGFNEVMPPDVLLSFDYQELGLLLFGTAADIDVSEWERCTKMALAHAATETAQWFWALVREMTPTQRRHLLQFTTGSSRVPIQGFPGLTSFDGRLCPFTVEAIRYTRGVYPRAHACFNRIDLPLYPTKDLMREGLCALAQLEYAEFTIV
ncbi:hypothetical protein SDRG_14817 [Saprolegnia diclina VS20]|uniref:HECT-type E3 ubiquitin transferase n=1 Tax=Saprolegnia diclina (strain VS20) TaxID=1156394 RepID=T0Q1W7_SAPDV|nr:hypothetical protein SDRG_14817 [Saprolegnia diclina VS20]EQC27375.1 hypothetical protein SDRG_14817 [Saprolegnia diclina VS20]|eukprot:XP_008619194.1 hypothetical protein SDRG_14817 [Saprolegnia diclina VS20]